MTRLLQVHQTGYIMYVFDILQICILKTPNIEDNHHIREVKIFAHFCNVCTMLLLLLWRATFIFKLTK